MGYVSVGVLQDNLVLSTLLIIWIGHCKKIRKLTESIILRRLFRRESLWIRSDERLTLETSACESLYGGQFTIINPADKTKLSWNSKGSDLDSGFFYCYALLRSFALCCCTYNYQELMTSNSTVKLHL